MYAEIFVSYPVDLSFTYGIPEGMDIRPGMRVKINFARRNIIGFVHDVHNRKPEDFKVKEIIEAVDPEPIFDGRLTDLARYMASNYLSSVGEAVSMALPSGLSVSKRFHSPYDAERGPEVGLNDDQERVFNDIVRGNERGEKFHLVFGVTGSGKTEVYIRLAKQVIAQGRSVIYLVPEISLSSQVYKRLLDVFGDDLMVYHSNISANQRLYSWKRFYAGEAKMAVGTRSAVFLQAPDLGLIIIDEEHDGSYKEHSTPRYNARRIALYRGKQENAIIVLGSATPSVESLYAAEKGMLNLHRLERRYGQASMPAIEIVKINPSKPDQMLSTALKLHTKRALDEGNQAIYLLNRRGFSPLVMCNACGAAVECPHCSISLNYHSNGNMVCHYCGHVKKLGELCAACSSDDLVKIGSGTQRMEEVILNTFKGYRVFRLDQDTSRKKDTFFKLIEQMNAGEIDILVGTQLVAKGFDFHKVTIVGVLLSDIGLHLPDFRASERIFSLLMQVAGRSGRGASPGRVIIQTLNPEHPIFNYILNHDYIGFYKSELDVRRQLGYPPFARLVRLLVRGKNEDDVIRSIESLKNALQEQIVKGQEKIMMLGPASAPFSKIAANYRYHIILKTHNLDLLRAVISESRESMISKNVYLEIDVDPYDLL